MRVEEETDNKKWERTTTGATTSRSRFPDFESRDGWMKRQVPLRWRERAGKRKETVVESKCQKSVSFMLRDVPWNELKTWRAPFHKQQHSRSNGSSLLCLNHENKPRLGKCFRLRDLNPWFSIYFPLDFISSLENSQSTAESTSWIDSIQNLGIRNEGSENKKRSKEEILNMFRWLNRVNRIVTAEAVTRVTMTDRQEKSTVQELNLYLQNKH